MAPFGASRAGLMSTRVDAIPDSVVDQLIHAYYPDSFTTSVWPDDVGSSDIDDITGLSADSSAFSNDGGVVGDGVDDHGLSDTMGDFGSDMTTDFAFAIGFSGVTDSTDHAWFGTLNDTDDTSLLVETGNSGISDGHFGVLLRDASGNRIRINESIRVDDGADYVLLFNKTGNLGSDLELYDAPDNDVGSSDTGEELSNGSNFEHDMSYFSLNNKGDIIRNADMTVNRIFWFNDSLNLTQRQDVYNELFPWWSE